MSPFFFLQVNLRPQVFLSQNAHFCSNAFAHNRSLLIRLPLLSPLGSPSAPPLPETLHSSKKQRLSCWNPSPLGIPFITRIQYFGESVRVYLHTTDSRKPPPRWPLVPPNCQPHLVLIQTIKASSWPLYSVFASFPPVNFQHRCQNNLFKNVSQIIAPCSNCPDVFLIY